MTDRLIQLVRRRWPGILLVIFTVAVLFRAVLVSTLQDGYYFADAPIYSAAAGHIVGHGEFPADYDRAPLYPLFLAAVYGAAGESITGPRVVQVFLGACIAVLIAVIARRMIDPLAGAIAGILWAIYPMGVFIAGLTYPTTLVTLLMGGGVLFLLADPGRRGYLLKVALAGFLFGLAVLTKPVVLGTIILLTCWIVFWSQTGRLLLASVFLCTAVATLVPWTVRNYQVFDRLVPIEARTLAKATPWAKVPRREDESENRTIRYLGRIAHRYPAQFISFFELYPRRVNFLKQEVRDRAHKREPEIVRHTSLGSGLVMAVSTVSVGFLYLFDLIGIRAAWRNVEKRRELTLLVLMVLSFALGYALTDGKIRYRIPVDPYIIILSSWGLVYMWDYLVKRKRVTD